MRAAIALLIVMWGVAAFAQSIGGNQGIGAGLSGASGGAAPVGCTNQLVLNYSNSCALIGQAWGQ